MFPKISSLVQSINVLPSIQRGVHSALSSAVLGLAKGLASAFRTLKDVIPNALSGDVKKDGHVERMLTQVRARAEISLTHRMRGEVPDFRPHLDSVPEGEEPEVAVPNEPRGGATNGPPVGKKATHAPAHHQERSSEVEDEVDLDALLNQMNTRAGEDAPWDIKNRIVRPAAESKVQAPRSGVGKPLEPAPAGSALKKNDMNKSRLQHGKELPKGVRWAKHGPDGTPVSDVKEVEKEKPFALYTPAQKDFYNVTSELDSKTTPEEGTYGYGFTVLGKAELDKGGTWNPDEVIAQGVRSPKEQSELKSDVMRLNLPDHHPMKMSMAEFLKKHVRH